MKVTGGFKTPFGLNQAKVEAYKAYLIFGAVLLFGVVLAFLVVKPRIAESIETNKEIDQLKTRLDNLNQKRDELSSLDGQEILTEVNKAVKALPSRKDIPGLVASVEKLVGLNQLTLNSFSLTPGKISTESSEVAQEEGTLEVQLGLSGTLENVKNFLAKTVSTARLLSIGNISLTSQKEGGLDVGIAVSYFYEPIPELVPKVDEPVAKLTDKEKEALNKVFGYVEHDYLSQPFQASPSSKTNPFSEL